MTNQTTMTPAELSALFDSAAESGAKSAAQFAEAGRRLAEQFVLKGGRKLAREAIRESMMHAALNRELLQGMANDTTQHATLVELILFHGEPTQENLFKAATEWAKNRKDSLVKGYRRALKAIGFTLEMGKERDPAKQSINFVKDTAAKPNPADGKETGSKPEPTTGENEPNTIALSDMSPAQQVATICGAIDALDAEQQDAIAAHLVAILEGRKGRNGKPVNQPIANQLRHVAQSAVQVTAH